MINIAIDGPSGAGKSTIAKALAKILNILYLDTGAMYRAAALDAFYSGIDVSDKDAVKKLADRLDLNIQYNNGEQRVILNRNDVSEKIREHFVSSLASKISAVPALRIKLVEIQRQTAQQFDCVLDGRDIGTFVLPNADLKIFLTATPEVRAARRLNELKQRGESAEYERILEDIKVRDHNDMTRDFAPLKKAADAFEVDSTSMSIDEVVEKIINLLNEHVQKR